MKDPIKKYLLFFGDDKLFKHQKIRLKAQAENTGWFDEIIVETPDTISEFVQEHKDLFANERGFGYWLWKPYIILKTLNKLNEGDLLFYVDAGTTIVEHRDYRFRAYCDILVNSDTPVITFSIHYFERLFHKMEVLKRFELDGITLDKNENFLNSNTVEGGIFMCRKSAYSLSFVKEWLNLMTENNYALTTDESIYEVQVEGFAGHRHDQSILSILSKLRKANILYSEAYGYGPFFSSRVTDAGERDKAPDIFRIESDYEFQKHPTWQHYLSDPEVLGRTVEKIKNKINDIVPLLTFDSPFVGLKPQFYTHIIPYLDSIQFTKGLLKVSLGINEYFPLSAISKNRLQGVVIIEIKREIKSTFYFDITPNGVEFSNYIENDPKRLYFNFYERLNVG